MGLSLLVVLNLASSYKSQNNAASQETESRQAAANVAKICASVSVPREAPSLAPDG